MSDDLKNRVKEIAEIAKQCPQGLQEKCFELLLADLLTSRKGQTPANRDGGRVAESKHAENNQDEVSAAEQTDIEDGDLHVKAKRFLKKYGLSISELNQILYKEGEEFLPLYEDLKTTGASESQIRIALLQALIAGLQSGEYQFDGENVRSECQERKCYDGGNFTANFKNNATFFEGFEKYDKKSSMIRLSEEGRKQLAELIRELG